MIRVMVVDLSTRSQDDSVHGCLLDDRDKG